jgi:adenine phosphoribosyltransferase
MTYKINIAGLERELPICPISDTLSIGAFVILGDAELSAAAARELIKLIPKYDYIITAEAKGIPLAHEIARQNGDRTYFVARKTPKLYMTGVFQVDVRSITTAKDQMLYIDTAEAALMKGKNILLVDDVISTGESIFALEKLVKKAGGNIVGRAAILAEGDAQKRKDIIYLEKLPLFKPDGTPIE